MKTIEKYNANPRLKPVNRSPFSDIYLGFIYIILIINLIVILFFMASIAFDYWISSIQPKDIIAKPNYLMSIDFDMPLETENALKHNQKQLLIYSFIPFIFSFIQAKFVQFFDLSFVNFIKYWTTYLVTVLAGIIIIKLISAQHEFMASRLEVITYTFCIIHYIVLTFVIYPIKFLSIYHNSNYQNVNDNNTQDQ